MDNYGVCWGAQYEIARGVSNNWWIWDALKNNDTALVKLAKCNLMSAPLVAEVMGRPEFASAVNYALW